MTQKKSPTQNFPYCLPLQTREKKISIPVSRMFAISMKMKLRYWNEKKKLHLNVCVSKGLYN